MITFFSILLMLCIIVFIIESMNSSKYQINNPKIITIQDETAGNSAYITGNDPSQPVPTNSSMIGVQNQSSNIEVTPSENLEVVAVQPNLQKSSGRKRKNNKKQSDAKSTNSRNPTKVPQKPAQNISCLNKLAVRCLCKNRNIILSSISFMFNLLCTQGYKELL